MLPIWKRIPHNYRVSPGARSMHKAFSSEKKKVRKTSIRMTAIKEYPFDLSDLQKQNAAGEQRRAPEHNPELPRPTATAPVATIETAPVEGKRKVSIMADEKSKDRENQPSDR
ncbi:hypothetical protein RR48_09225 [Papilio machaon]|uniref:Uncharacterized protein n=1 Tax=Papilio machaon TaxID=76193 RepID=A0A194RBI8_PAPMA|nr:hypothetical protein RR48_09225 [Papilio machaon]